MDKRRASQHFPDASFGPPKMKPTLRGAAKRVQPLKNFQRQDRTAHQELAGPSIAAPDCDGSKLWVFDSVTNRRVFWSAARGRFSHRQQTEPAVSSRIRSTLSAVRDVVRVHLTSQRSVEAFKSVSSDKFVAKKDNPDTAYWSSDDVVPTTTSSSEPRGGGLSSEFAIIKLIERAVSSISAPEQRRISSTLEEFRRCSLAALDAGEALQQLLRSMKDAPAGVKDLLRGDTGEGFSEIMNSVRQAHENPQAFATRWKSMLTEADASEAFLHATVSSLPPLTEEESCEREVTSAMEEAPPPQKGGNFAEEADGPQEPNEAKWTPGVGDSQGAVRPRSLEKPATVEEDKEAGRSEKHFTERAPKKLEAIASGSGSSTRCEDGPSNSAMFSRTWGEWPAHMQSLHGTDSSWSTWSSQTWRHHIPYEQDPETSPFDDLVSQWQLPARCNPCRSPRHMWVSALLPSVKKPFSERVGDRMITESVCLERVLEPGLRCSVGVQERKRAPHLPPLIAAPEIKRRFLAKAAQSELDKINSSGRAWHPYGSRAMSPDRVLFPLLKGHGSS